MYLAVGDEAPLNTLGTRFPRTVQKQVPVAEELFGAGFAQNHATVDGGGYLEGNTRGNVRLDE